MRTTDLTYIDARRRLVGGSLLLAAVVAVTSAEFGPSAAADPTSRPAATGPATAVAGGHGHGGGYHDRMMGQPTTREREDALTFMSIHAPIRYGAMIDIRNQQEKSAVEGFAIDRIVPLMRSEREDPDLYKVAVRRIEIEDRVFDFAGQVHQAGTNADAARLKKQLRDKVADDVDVRLEEQKLRLERLRQTVEFEQQQLDVNVGHREQLVEDQFKHLLKYDFQRPFQTGGRRNRNAGDGAEPSAPVKP